MAYKLEFKQSPNYTPGHLTKQFYGKPRTIDFGAGHWWGDPNAGYNHDGVVNTFMNPARQASAHAVISAGRVTEMVRAEDTSWATGSANPFTFSIEMKPNMTPEDRATLVEYIADKGFHKLPWFPHKHWANTACNPFDWEGIRRDAEALVNSRNNPEWVKNIKDIEPIKLMVLKPQTQIIDLNNLSTIKPLGQGTWVDFVKRTVVNGKEFLISSYSVKHSLPNGIPKEDVGIPVIEPAPVNEKPEWLQNWKDITDEIMYTRVDAPLVNLLTGETIKIIPRGKEIEVASATEWHGQKYIITVSSTSKMIPNGISLDDLDKKPVVITDPIIPSGQQPDIKDIEKRLTAVEAFVKMLMELFKKLGN